MSGKIVTNDFNLNKVAQLRGVAVLNINELANALKPVVLPGEVMRVFVLKEGKEPGQGVAYLDDGTMVVVDQGKRAIGRTIEVTVTSVLQTTAGKMIFCRWPEATAAAPAEGEARREEAGGRTTGAKPGAAASTAGSPAASPTAGTAASARRGWPAGAERRGAPAPPPLERRAQRAAPRESPRSGGAGGPGSLDARGRRRGRVWRAAVIVIAVAGLGAPGDGTRPLGGAWGRPSTRSSRGRNSPPRSGASRCGASRPAGPLLAQRREGLRPPPP